MWQCQKDALRRYLLQGIGNTPLVKGLHSASDNDLQEGITHP